MAESGPRSANNLSDVCSVVLQCAATYVSLSKQRPLLARTSATETVLNVHFPRDSSRTALRRSAFAKSRTVILFLSARAFTDNFNL